MVYVGEISDKIDKPKVLTQLASLAEETLGQLSLCPSEGISFFAVILELQKLQLCNTLFALS